MTVETIQLVELDIDFCSLTYGTAPCTAGLTEAILDETGEAILDEDGNPLIDESATVGTGTKRCFNTYATCQARAAYDPETKTLRYAYGTRALDEAGIAAIPSVVSIKHSPGRLRIAEDLGERASVRITFEDHRHSDIGLDPYLSTRDYDPLTQGTYWGRFVARNKFLIARELRTYYGRADQAQADMEERHYVVESISGPDLDGKVVITAKDPLRLTDGDQAQAPAASTGRLSASLTDSGTSITLVPAGIGDAEYAGVNYIAINDEIVEVTARTGDDFTIVRGQLGTEAQAHEEGDTAQVVLEYVAEEPHDILNDLLTTYANVPSSYINLTVWGQNDANYVGRNFTGRIAEPTPVRKLIAELLEQVGANMWWEETTQQIRYEPLRLPVSPPSITEENMLEDSFASRTQSEKRISRVWTYYGQINPLEPDEPRNYRAVAVDIDSDAETANEYGRQAIKKIFSRWIPAAGRTAAQTVNARLLQRRRDPPRQFTFDLSRFYGETYRVGSAVQIGAQPLQDDEGFPELVRSLIISVGAEWDRLLVTAEEFTFDALSGGGDPVGGGATNPVRALDFVTDTSNVNLREQYNNNYPDPEDLRQTISSVDDSTDTFTLNGHGYDDDARVVLFGADLPAPLVEGTVYWIVGATANTFQLSATQGGSAIDLTDAGTGTQEIRYVIDVPVTIDPDVQIFSTSTAFPALNVGNWPDGINITLDLRSGSYIVGAGGDGADETVRSSVNNGAPGGTALFTRYDITITNEGTIGGGGGGGGAGFATRNSGTFTFLYTLGGGGGAGRVPGAGGARIGTVSATQNANAEPGTIDAGGAGADAADFVGVDFDLYVGTGGTGGALGAAGATGSATPDPNAPPPGTGGAGGAAIDGDSFVSISGGGTVAGAQIN